MMEMHISDDYHALRLRELELTADYQMKVQEEREAAREERARLREEQQAEKELRAERERLEKERAHYAAVLEALVDTGREDERYGLQAKIDEIDGRIADNGYRTANIRAGYVYVISNIGSFGPRHHQDRNDQTTRADGPGSRIGRRLSPLRIRRPRAFLLG
jgi:hypothetical protein